ncbi:MAG: hypothetical protein IPH54_15380 [Rhodoferax sp.]|nr:hypothetical protein [Rhodoferax sp.]
MPVSSSSTTAGHSRPPDGLRRCPTRRPRCAAPLWDHHAEPVDTDADLYELLWAEMNLCTGTSADTTTTDKETIALFQRWMTRNGAARCCTCTACTARP